MDGPERLEDDARPGRRGAAILVGVVVLVVAGLGAVRVTGALQDPAPPSVAPSRPATARAPRESWPQGVGTGTLYVLDAAGVATLDVGSGFVQRSALRVDPGLVTLTAGGPGVLVWFYDDDGTPHLVTAGTPQTPVVGPVLAQGRQFLPGPGTAVWSSRDDGGTESRRATWRLVDTDDSVAASVRLAGSVGSDGSGGLLAFEDERVRHVVPGQPDATWTGAVGAVGPDGFERLQCQGPRCTALLHDRASGDETRLATTTSDDGDGAVLSPGNRFVASVQEEPGTDGSMQVRVALVGDRQQLRSWPLGDDTTASLAWLSDRWLAVSGGDQGLVLYDAVDDRLVTPGVELTLPTQLVFRPA